MEGFFDNIFNVGGVAMMAIAAIVYFCYKMGWIK